MCSLSELQHVITVYLLSCHSEATPERETAGGGRQSEALVLVKS